MPPLPTTALPPPNTFILGLDFCEPVTAASDNLICFKLNHEWERGGTGGGVKFDQRLFSMVVWEVERGREEKGGRGKL